MINKVIGNLRIVKEIGRGGMGVVYLAENVNLGKKFAVKCLVPEYAMNVQLKNRFSIEAKNHAKIEHQNIVQIYDYYEYQSNFFLVMEYFDGISLEKLINSRQYLEEHVALSIVIDILKGLNFAHKQGIIHRDIKPSNILVNKKFKAKIIDFGIAILMNNERLTLTGNAIVGTPQYMSPEQIVSPRSIDHRSDVYSMGVILYEMLTGVIPFDSDESEYRIKEKHIHNSVPEGPLQKRNVSNQLIDIIKKALEKDPNKRFNGCGELYQYIKAYMDSSGNYPGIILCNNCHTRFKIKATTSLTNKSCPKCKHPFIPSKKEINEQAQDTLIEEIDTEEQTADASSDNTIDEQLTRQKWSKKFLSLDSLFSFLVLLFILIAPFIFIKNIYDFANLPQSFFIQTGALLFMFLLFVKEIIKKQLQIQVFSLHIPLLLLIIWLFSSFFWAINKYEAVSIVMHWTAVILILFLIVHHFKTIHQCLIILDVIFFSVLIISIIGIFQHLFEFSWIPQAEKPAATFANKEMAVHFISITLPVGIGLFLYRANTQLQALYYLTACAIVFVFLVYTASWLAVITTIVQFICWFVLLYIVHSTKEKTFYWQQHSKKFIGIFLFIVIMIHLTPNGFAIPEYLQKWHEGAFDKKNSFIVRTKMNINTLQMIFDNFITGVGPGNFKVYYPIFSNAYIKDTVFGEEYQPVHLHNDFIQIWAETGTTGIVLFVWVAFITLKLIFSLLSGEKAKIKFVYLGIFFSLIGYLITAFFSFPSYRSIPPFIICIYIGILCIAYDKRSKGKVVYIKQWIFPCMAIICLFSLIYCSSFMINWLKCDKYYHKITSAEKAKLWESVIDEAYHAIELNPYRKKIYSYMGRAYIESGQSNKGIAALSNVVEVYPYHMNALLNLGVAYGRVSDFNQSLSFYNRVLDIKDDYAKVYNNIANNYLKQKKLDKAYEYFQLAAKYDVKNPIIFFNIGIVALNKKLFKEAKQAFQKSIDLKPTALAYKNLGIVQYEYLEEKKEGASCFKKALAIDPAMKDHNQMKRIVEQYY